MPPISIIIKPASSNCNLRCKYCFYHSLSEDRNKPSHGFMNEDTLSDILTKALAFADGNLVMLSFQGGEPLLAGKEFFRNIQTLIFSLNTKRSAVHIGIQTNGILIDEEWCEIFKRGHYLVGLSLDGDEIANNLRVDSDGNPTFSKVLASAKLLQKFDVDFNILAVLTKPVAERITHVYTFFRKQNFKHLQFIPCLKPLALDKSGMALSTPNYREPSLEGAKSQSKAQKLKAQGQAECGVDIEEDKETDYSLSSTDYENFLKKAFSLYTKDYIDGRFTSVRQFDNFVRLANSQRAEQCGMNGHCCHQFVIEADGEVYPCDFYCLDKYSLGKIQDTDFFALSTHPVAVDFIEESLGIDEKCKTCIYYRLCKNGCKRERIDIDKCLAYQSFFPYALPHLKRMS